jgi:phosphate starvation-inducible protein PhoH and related proteins
MGESSRVRFDVADGLDVRALCGAGDEVLRAIEERFGARVALRDGALVVDADASRLPTIASLAADLMQQVERGAAPTAADVADAADILRAGEYAPSALRDDVVLTFRGRAICPKTAGQKRYCDAIRANTVTFGTGPAGTGKTYLAMALAIAALKRKEVGRIVLTRPVVEAGENLGFLPGTLTEKVDPYVRPLYDALFDMTDMEKGSDLLERGIIEVAPLAFMRGRTFNDSFLILDEAQNTTPEQMKMFLTRLGFNSKMVVTGDDTQLDLPHGVSGLRDVRRVLDGIDDVAFCDFTGADVVRHALVAKIVAAYERAQGRQEELRFPHGEGEEGAPGASDVPGAAGMPGAAGAGEGRRA